MSVRGPSSGTAARQSSPEHDYNVIKHQVATKNSLRTYVHIIPMCFKCKVRVFPVADLEVLLTPDEIESRFGIHVALDMQLTPQTFWAAEKHPCLCWGVNLPDRSEYHIPVWSTKVCRRAESSNRILLRVGIIDHDVGRVISFDLGSQVLLQWSVRVAWHGFASLCWRQLTV